MRRFVSLFVILSYAAVVVFDCFHSSGFTHVAIDVFFTIFNCVGVYAFLEWGDE